MSRVIRNRLAALLVIGLAVTACLPAAQALAAQPRTSLTAVENDLMCVACHEPLAVSQSPEAGAERRLIVHLVALGDTKAQVEHVMVAQYGPTVLAKPPASGFDLTVYVLPPVALLVGVAIVGLSLARWRRGRREVAPPGPMKPLSGGDARRLEEDLARYKG